MTVLPNLATSEKRAPRTKTRSRNNKSRPIVDTSETESGTNSGAPLRDAPKTPQKGKSRQQAPQEPIQIQQKAQPINTPGAQNPQKQAKNRSRPKNLPNSPQGSNNQYRSGNNRQTTPPNSAGIVRPASTAFAGSTFHASPAPSSLPMPKFMNKKSSSPETSAASIDTDSSSSSHPSQCTPTRLSVGSAPPRPGQLLASPSPLEMFFQADRAEKQRSKMPTPQGSEPNSAHPGGTLSISTTPPSEHPALLNAIFSSVQNSPSANKVARSAGSNRPNYSRAADSESDSGYHRRPTGSPFSQPLSEAWTSSSGHYSPSPSTQKSVHTPPPQSMYAMPTPPRGNIQTPPRPVTQTSEEATAALKTYLFNIPTPESPSTSSQQRSYGSGHGSSFPQAPQYGYQRSFQSIYQTPAQPYPAMPPNGPQRSLEPGFLPYGHGKPTHMVPAGVTDASLEDRVRQMLKIAPSGSA